MTPTTCTGDAAIGAVRAIRAIRESSTHELGRRIARAVAAALALLIAAALVTDAVILFVAAGSRLGVREARALAVAGWTARVEAGMP